MAADQLAELRHAGVWGVDTGWGNLCCNHPQLLFESLEFTLHFLGFSNRRCSNKERDNRDHQQQTCNGLNQAVAELGHERPRGQEKEASKAAEKGCSDGKISHEGVGWLGGGTDQELTSFSRR